jgi:hypothetical protein
MMGAQRPGARVPRPVQVRPADTVVAFDLQQRRMTAFDATGAVAWASSIGAAPPRGSLASFDDGSFLWAWRIA